MKHFPILFLLFFATSVVGQEAQLLDSSYLSGKVRFFRLDDEGFKGPGAAALDEIAAGSQFVMLGEVHGSPLLSEFVEAWVPMLDQYGFRDFAAEVGPFSGEKLEELANPPEQAQARMQSFYSQYSFKAIDDLPIPFFDGLEDVAFLQQMTEKGWDLWGLDQEYYSSVFFLLDDLLKLAEERQDYEELVVLKKKTEKVIRKWLKKEDRDKEGFPVFSEILQEPAIIAFFNSFGEEDHEALEIIEALKISWDIYDRYRGGASHNDRVAYIRNNFMRNYEKKLAEGAEAPKVFLKFGRLHASKLEYGDTQDIGQLVHELAEEQGTVCTNIAVWKRYQMVNGESVDLMKKYPKYYSRYLPFMLFGSRDQWALIDLKSIRKDLEAGRIRLPENENTERLRKLIYGFDYQLILPGCQRDVDTSPTR
jgi:hypothetical protein